MIAWQRHPYFGQRYPLPLNLTKDREFGVLPSPPLAVVDQYVLICTLPGGVEHRVTHLLSHGIPFVIPPDRRAIVEDLHELQESRTFRSGHRCCFRYTAA